MLPMQISANCKTKPQDALKNFYKKIRKNYSEKSAGL